MYVRNIITPCADRKGGQNKYLVVIKLLVSSFKWFFLKVLFILLKQPQL